MRLEGLLLLLLLLLVFVVLATTKPTPMHMPVATDSSRTKSGIGCETAQQ
jgi:hypothetical protein